MFGKLKLNFILYDQHRHYDQREQSSANIIFLSRSIFIIKSKHFLIKLFSYRLYYVQMKESCDEREKVVVAVPWMKLLKSVLIL